MPFTKDFTVTEVMGIYKYEIFKVNSTLYKGVLRAWT